MNLVIKEHEVEGLDAKEEIKIMQVSTFSALK